jgi:GH15 family glucan-1,4-alpha-glucosidase
MSAQFDPARLPDGGLGARSVNVLLAGQSPSGALVACPTYPMYRFAWLRDGAFCARALDAAGHRDRAAAFHGWVARTLLGHRKQVERVVDRLANGRVPAPEEMPPARYVLDGRIEEPGSVYGEVWPNYQLDGYGSWLFELAAHVQRGGTPDVAPEAVELAARYLAAAWRTDCWDCWEERGDGQHASTLAAIAAGLAGAGRLLDSAEHAKTAALVRASMLDRFVRDGLVRKGARDDRLDASLLWLALPYGILGPDDPVMRGTAEAIRAQLRGSTGGIHRYLGDTYYGGGEWVLLTCWLGWYDAVTGEEAEWATARDWVIKQASAELDLPEQTTGAVQDPSMVEPWVRRWGTVATPLLWSHAMYLLMMEAGQRWI